VQDGTGKHTEDGCTTKYCTDEGSLSVSVEHWLETHRQEYGQGRSLQVQHQCKHESVEEIMQTEGNAPIMSMRNNILESMA